ncbi:MAG: hypothetical protein K8T89_15445 [Planctomycetes bacterium]|nr:hypothetical protein [Planctomycetota bacterium]
MERHVGADERRHCDHFLHRFGMLSQPRTHGGDQRIHIGRRIFAFLDRSDQQTKSARGFTDHEFQCGLIRFLDAPKHH